MSQSTSSPTPTPANSQGGPLKRGSPLDLVYIVRETETNEELRYSLRSLVNLDHGRVWVAGYKPSWVRNVEYVPVSQQRGKNHNSTNNLLAACRHPDLPEWFVLFNDDFFVLRQTEVTPRHRGTVAEVLADYTTRYGGINPAMGYVRGMAATGRLLESWGYENPKSYEIHAPMPIHKQTLVEVVERARRDDRTIPVLHKRTLVGNVSRLGGRKMVDVKVKDNETTWKSSQVFVSTGDQAFRNGAIGRRLREKFSEPSIYEEA